MRGRSALPEGQRQRTVGIHARPAILAKFRALKAALATERKGVLRSRSESEVFALLVERTVARLTPEQLARYEAALPAEELKLEGFPVADVGAPCPAPDTCPFDLPKGHKMHDHPRMD